MAGLPAEFEASLNVRTLAPAIHRHRAALRNARNVTGPRSGDRFCGSARISKKYWSRLQMPGGSSATRLTLI